MTGATTEGLPPGVLYHVRATYKYTREDVDEISFEVGDTIQVVEYEDPEEQVSTVDINRSTPECPLVMSSG